MRSDREQTAAFAFLLRSLAPHDYRVRTAMRFSFGSGAVKCLPLAVRNEFALHTPPPSRCNPSMHASAQTAHVSLPRAHWACLDGDCVGVCALCACGATLARGTRDASRCKAAAEDGAVFRVLDLECNALCECSRLYICRGGVLM